MNTANLKLFGIVGLRGLAMALTLSGQTRAGAALYTLADAVESGAYVDAQLQLVADKLKTRPANDDDWADVAERIETKSDRLQDS